MRTRLLNIGDDLRANFWFLPGLLLLLGLALAIVVPLVDVTTQKWLEYWFPWIKMDASTALNFLSSIATAIVTVAGIVFSVTMVTLSIAASQFGPRLLRTFMSNRTVRLSLGLFVGTSIYCLTVMFWIRGEDQADFVPHLSLTLGLLLTLLSLAILIYFFHTIAILIQPSYFLKNVAADLDQTIARLYPQQLGESPLREISEDEISTRLERQGPEFGTLCAEREGYLEALDDERMMELAVELDLVLDLLCRPGDFITRGMSIARVWPASRLDPDNSHRMNLIFLIGNRPTSRQDIDSAIKELVEVAVRALSPSTNDPFTAFTCLDRLGSSLTRLVQRDYPSPYRLDENHRLRLVARGWNTGEVLEAAFAQFRLYGASNAAVMHALLEQLELLMQFARRRGDFIAILHQAELARSAFERKLKGVPEQQPLIERQEKLARRLRENIDDSQRWMS